MAKIVRDNRFYFYLVGVFILLGGVYLFLNDKSEAILFFSENRTPFLDTTFSFLTRLGEGPMYFVVGIAALAIRLRYTFLVAITGFSVMGLSNVLKAFFAVDRPMAFFAKQNLVDKLTFVEGIEMHSGATSFPSGHTMSAFALYGLLVLLLPSKKTYAALLFLLALLVGISRIYLVQHFWPDVYVGAILGVFLALFIFTVQAKFAPSATGFVDRPLFDFARKKA